MQRTLFFTVVLLLIGGALSLSDYLLVERAPVASTPGVTDTNTSSSASSAPAIIKKGSSTQKATSKSVDEILSGLQLIQKATTEQSLIEQAAGSSVEVKKFALLRNNDRAFFFAMIEGTSVKKVLATLKQNLQEQFSADLKELKDQTLTSDDGPPADLLSFIDPKISPEPLLFLRVRDRLYELHVAENGQDLLEAMLRELRR